MKKIMLLLLSVVIFSAPVHALSQIWSHHESISIKNIPVLPVISVLLVGMAFTYFIENYHVKKLTNSDAFQNLSGILIFTGGVIGAIELFKSKKIF